jgi:hypothetical protein
MLTNAKRVYKLAESFMTQRTTVCAMQAPLGAMSEICHRAATKWLCALLWRSSPAATCGAFLYAHGTPKEPPLSITYSSASASLACFLMRHDRQVEESKPLSRPKQF